MSSTTRLRMWVTTVNDKFQAHLQYWGMDLKPPFHHMNEGGQYVTKLCDTVEEAREWFLTMNKQLAEGMRQKDG